MSQNIYNDMFPTWVTNKAIAIYIAVLLVVFLAMSNPMEWYFYIFGFVEVVGFFYAGHMLCRSWKRVSPKLFEKKLFGTALAIRIIVVLFLYWFYTRMNGDSFEFNAADVLFYDGMAQEFARNFSAGNFRIYDIYTLNSSSSEIADMGYATYLGFIYWFTGGSVLVTRFLKAFYGAITCVLIYRLATRNFGEEVGRVSAILTMLMPNLIMYCGLHLKETEMVFLLVLFIERSEGILRSRKFDFWQMFPTILIGTTLFFFRTVLAAVAFLALVTALVLTSTRVVGWGKRIAISGLAVLFLGAGFGDRFIAESNKLFQQRIETENFQQTNREWRSQRKDSEGYSNKYIKYVGASTMAPLIFTIPFPSMSFTYGQENQRQIHGGNYCKNVTSGFTIFALFALLFSGDWRRHVFPLSAMLGYLLVLVMSTFAHSERFHLPTVPLELMFAAYGLSIVRTSAKYKRWFNYWMVFVFVAAVGWNWFKLKGRGMI